MHLIEYIIDCIVTNGDPELSKGVVLDNIVTVLSYAFIGIVYAFSEWILHKKTKLDVLMRFLCACGIVVAVLVLTMALFVFGEEMVNLFKNLIK